MAHESIEPALLVLTMDDKQRSLDVARIHTQFPREVPHDHEEPVPVVEVEAGAARFLCYDAELVEKLPDAVSITP
jgi:hypothetical protein